MLIRGIDKKDWLAFLEQKNKKIITVAHLEVQVFQASHSGAADRIGQLKASKVCIGANNDSVESNLVLETINIVGGVRINILEGLCELVIHAVDEGNDGALEENGLAVLGNTILLGLFLFLDVFFDNILRIGLQDAQEAV
jgi:hypothetical protein